ncbi:Thioredoxin-like protein CDSP32, chloroplastic [Sesamum alatum]|uniref:Thioredoxin-like protein CDSP32, chloroplastic n=1 Tax=Sesamum alatum TaxID=300844 RepID=A0AAE1YWX3_9LAMI|nr:Thioredoxin-like protein CDSP32, chloroplastic [Sesamum alatum]
MEKIHEEEGFQPEKLVSNILYYGDDPFSHVVQLQSGEDLEKLIKVHRIDHKLIVVNVGMTQCIPCVKIYPSVLKLASQMAGRVVFARMNADENDSCMQMLREMDVSRVPAFLFLKNGELCGRRKFDTEKRTYLPRGEMELKIVDERSPRRREFRFWRAGRNQKAAASNILEAIAEFSGGETTATEDGRMKIVVKTEDLKQVLEAIRGGRSWGRRASTSPAAVSLEQRLNLMRRRQILRATSQGRGRGRGCWRPALQSIPEEL